MSFEIRREDCQFFVNKEKRTVVCVIEDTCYTFINTIEKNFPFSILHGNPFYQGAKREALLQKCVMPNRFVGRAVCSEDDEWDEEFGKHLAYVRCALKVHKSFMKRANKFYSYAHTWLNDIRKTFLKIDSDRLTNHDRELQYLKKKFDENEKTNI